jgi:hypothetical protein
MILLAVLVAYDPRNLYQLGDQHEPKSNDHHCPHRTPAPSPCCYQATASVSSIESGPVAVTDRECSAAKREAIVFTHHSGD